VVSPLRSNSSGELGPGTRLGRYELLFAVAQGGMARVWAARQHGTLGFSKIVAVKTIRPDLAHDARFRSMFLEEAQLASLVHHPNVCEILDLGEQGDLVYLAMEWIDGEGLARMLKPADEPLPLDFRISAKIIADACAGLHAAHQLTDDDGQRLRLVHCDVSTQNLMVSRAGAVKVIDWGVAKALHSARDDGLVMSMEGKAAYMSPEQAAGKRAAALSDVFALGICLYEITTGKRPFSGGSREATIERLKDGTFSRPSELDPEYPRRLEQIVLRAMAHNTLHRYSSAERMRVALLEYLAHSGPVVTDSEVAAVVTERVGPLIDQRRAYIGRVTAKG
jgi:eukaryotic-like serine/threonine-protein kinase